MSRRSRNHPEFSRRALLGGASAVLATGAGFAVLAARRPRAALAANPEPGSPVKRVMVIGSSMIVGALGRFLAEELERKGFESDRQAKSASGLSRPDFFDWPRELRAAMKAFEPDATVVMFGGNDAQGIWTRSEPKWIRWPEPAWTAWYAGRVAELAGLLTASGQRLIWLGAPRMRSNELDDRMKRLNGIYAQQMSLRPNARFIATAPALVDRNGNYARELVIDGKKRDVRTADGVHVTVAGARRVVGHVLPEVVEFLEQSRLVLARASDAPCLPPNRR